MQIMGFDCWRVSLTNVVVVPQPGAPQRGEVHGPGGVRRCAKESAIRRRAHDGQSPQFLQEAARHWQADDPLSGVREA